MKPVQLLTKLCKEGKVDGPHFAMGKVRVGDMTFKLQKDPKEIVSSKSEFSYYDNNQACKAKLKIACAPFSVCFCLPSPTSNDTKADSHYCSTIKVEIMLTQWIHKSSCLFL